MYSGKAALPIKLAALLINCHILSAGSLAVTEAAKELKSSPSLDAAVAVAALSSAQLQRSNLLIHGS